MNEEERAKFNELWAKEKKLERNRSGEDGIFFLAGQRHEIKEMVYKERED